MEKKINERKSLLREAEKVAPKKSRNQNEEQDEFEDEEEVEYKPVKRARRTSAFSGILTKIIIILILIIIILGAGYFVFTKKMEPKKEVSLLIVQNQLSYCQELVTIKYRYSDILSIKKSLGFSKSYSIIKYSGIIRIGIPDLSLCDIEVTNEGKTLNIKLPDVEILGNDITSQEVFDESHSLFVPVSLDEAFAEIQRAKDNTLEELVDEGIMKEARENAKKVIQQIMMSAGFEEVIVV